MVVGVNLLREGLDLPEVSLVAILDADKEGFLRSETSLIQTIGRAARHLNARVILYADQITGSMARAMEETRRRREKQLQYNLEHGIVPRGIEKQILPGIEEEIRAQKVVREVMGRVRAARTSAKRIQDLEGKMLEAAEALDFELAAGLRDRIQELTAPVYRRPGGSKTSRRGRRRRRGVARPPTSASPRRGRRARRSMRKSTDRHHLAEGKDEVEPVLQREAREHEDGSDEERDLHARPIVIPSARSIRSR